MIGIHSNSPYWRDIPVRRMWKLLAAAFFAFANVGFFVDLVGWGLLSIPEALGWVALVGGFAAAVTAVASKKRVLIPVVVLIYVIATFAFASRPHTTKQAPLPPAAYRRLLFDAIGMMAASIIAASLFMTFASSEGTQLVALETELELATRLQNTLVPAVELKVGDLELFARTIPSQKVGGDLVDAFERSGYLTAYVTDVSGHGIPAGTLMGMIKMAVRLFSMETNEPIDPAALLTAVNRTLPFVKEPNMYATAACITAGRDGYASFCTAGHGPILQYSRSTGEISRLAMEQFPLGLFSFEYAAQKSAFEAGDVFVICTDGILEAENASGEEFGTSRVEQILMENAREKPGQIFERIMAAVEQHCPKAADDRSLLILRKTYVQ